MRHPTLSFCASGILLLCAVFAGCREREVTSYRIPKEKGPDLPAAMPATVGGAVAATPAASGPMMPAAGAPMTGTPATATGSGDLIWTAPAHWVSKPASAMRRATYAIAGDGAEAADLSISALSGPAGGEFANINRWRGQLPLPPLTEAELATAVTRFEQNGLRFAVVDFSGTTSPAQRVIGAMVPVGPSTWFFKLTGPAGLLAREKPAFDAFLKTIRVPAATP